MQIESYSDDACKNNFLVRSEFLSIKSPKYWDKYPKVRGSARVACKMSFVL